MSTVISVRIRKEVKDLLERAGIDIGKVVREYLEELAWRIKVSRTVEKWDRLLENVRPSEPGFAAKSVREDRESH